MLDEVRTNSCFKASGRAVVPLALGTGMPFIQTGKLNFVLRLQREIGVQL